LVFLRQRGTAAKLAEIGGDFGGFVAYQTTKNFVELVNFATGLGFRRSGVAKKLIGMVEDHATKEGKELIAAVPESALSCHLFLRGRGYVCVKTRHDEDGERYVFSRMMGE
jgi:GNAT superfamily N-acetyltransferase